MTPALRRAAALAAPLIALAAWILSPGAGGSAATELRATADPGAELSTALARSVRRSDAPGATAAVIADGELVWTGATGRARDGAGASMRPGSLFPIASTTKTVTATLAMALAEDGALALERPIADALPKLPAAHRITPRQLLNHSSGLSEYFADGVIDRQASRRPYRRWTRAAVLRHVVRVKFAPGSRNGYSNSGYVALGGVLEHASGESIDALFQRLIATPLGLHDSSFEYGGAPQREFAHPLSSRRGGRFHDRFGARARIPTDYWGGVWTDGGLASTSADLARIGNALYAGDLLPPDTVREMLPPKPRGWGLGSFDKQALGRTWIGHDGSYGGYQTENWTDRERGVTVVVMTNAAGSGAVSPRIWRAVAMAYRG